MKRLVFFICKIPRVQKSEGVGERGKGKESPERKTVGERGRGMPIFVPV